MSTIPSILGPFDMGGVKRPIISTEKPNKTKKSKKVRISENPSTNVDREVDGTEELSSVAPLTSIELSLNSQDNQDLLLTLEERLDKLSSELLEEFPENKNPISEVATTDSLVILIDQALQSGDDTLLEQCFCCDDNDIIEATSRRISSSRVLQLLKKIVAKFEKRPSRGFILTKWLSNILKFHTSFLISISDLANQLSGLSQMLEQRLSTYTMLASLGGRLDLLMSQILSSQPGSKEGTREAVPRQIYIED